MKWVLVLFLCFSCFAWDDLEETKQETKTETKGDSKAWTTAEYIEHIHGNVSYIKYSLFPFDETGTHESMYEMVGDIRSNLEEWKINLQPLYDGYEKNPQNESAIDLDNFRTFYNGVFNLNNIGLQQLPDPNIQSYAYMQYIKGFSTLLYQDYTNDNLPDNYLNYPDKFSFVEPIAKALDEETTDFQPDTLKNVQGMQKINSVNTYVDEILTDIAKNPNESNFNSDFLVGGSNLADTTFHIDLSSLGQLWVNLANKYGGGSGSSPATKGSVITTNPFRDWVFDLRLRPRQGDYLYSIYTWWNSDQLLPCAIRYTLQALVYAYTFYYCFTYTKELWSK